MSVEVGQVYEDLHKRKGPANEARFVRVIKLFDLGVRPRASVENVSTKRRVRVKLERLENPSRFRLVEGAAGGNA